MAIVLRRRGATVGRSRRPVREWNVYVTVGLDDGRQATWQATVFSQSALQARRDGRLLAEAVLPDKGGRLASISVAAAPAAPRPGRAPG